MRTEREMRVYRNNKKKILIVEGSDAVARYLGGILEAHGSVDIVQNGKEALIKISLNNYDVVVADATMPVMDGIELHKAAIETDAALKHRFLFLTNSFFRYYLKFFADNEISFLFKPADIHDINNGVADILSEAPARMPDTEKSTLRECALKKYVSIHET